VLRNHSLPDTAFEYGAADVAGLNAAFPMDCHGGMCFTIWYGVFDRASRILSYCSAGHHPADLVGRDGPVRVAPQTRNLPVGALPGYRFKAERVMVGPGERLFLFSDGAFEIRSEEGEEGRLEEFVLRLGSPAGRSVAELLHWAQQRSPARAFEDDFTLLCLRFA